MIYNLQEMSQVLRFLFDADRHIDVFWFEKKENWNLLFKAITDLQLGDDTRGFLQSFQHNSNSANAIFSVKSKQQDTFISVFIILLTRSKKTKTLNEWNSKF